MFELHQPLLADLGPYETVPRAGAIDALGLHIMSPFLLDLVTQLVPSAEPKEADLRFALQRLLMLFPDMNTSAFSNLTWLNKKAERLSTILNHLRRLKRSDEVAQYKVMAKLNGPAWAGNKQIINKRTHKRKTSTNKQPTPATNQSNKQSNQPWQDFKLCWTMSSSRLMKTARARASLIMLRVMSQPSLHLQAVQLIGP